MFIKNRPGILTDITFLKIDCIKKLGIMGEKKKNYLQEITEFKYWILK